MKPKPITQRRRHASAADDFEALALYVAALDRTTDRRRLDRADEYRAADRRRDRAERFEALADAACEGAQQW